MIWSDATASKWKRKPWIVRRASREAVAVSFIRTLVLLQMPSGSLVPSGAGRRDQSNTGNAVRHAWLG